MTVKGVQFVTDTEGRKVAVLLDLEEWGELWEDIYDNALADERAGEPTTSLEDFEAELRSEGLLNE
jgi:PHD/YefM family antitoxin component YafN of YafNO toxin-antitoxin module